VEILATTLSSGFLFCWPIKTCQQMTFRPIRNRHFHTTTKKSKKLFDFFFQPPPPPSMHWQASSMSLLKFIARSYFSHKQQTTWVLNIQLSACSRWMDMVISWTLWTADWPEMKSSHQLEQVALSILHLAAVYLPIHIDKPFLSGYFLDQLVVRCAVLVTIELGRERGLVDHLE
jgi:hypothetical protein